MKRFILTILLAATSFSASGFSLLGPLDVEDWQVVAIGYESTAVDIYGVDVGTPRNREEEYRWNTPVLYYAFDRSFEHFGPEGIAAVDAAFRMLNNVTNVSSYSSELVEYPLDSTRINFQAQALDLIDMKSYTLKFMLEELGLGSAERWTFSLRDRLDFGPVPCPDTVEYSVIQRNYDVDSRPLKYSPYVNGTLFSYQIVDFCTPPPPTQIVADAIEFPVDPLAQSTAIAGVSLLDYGDEFGGYYTELTRDDVAGLRFMWQTNNMNLEPQDPLSVMIQTTATNNSFRTTVTTSNLADLILAQATLTPLQFAQQFPDIVTTSTNSTFELVVTPVLVAFFTNFPGSTVGSPATLVVRTELVTNVQEVFTYTFANVVTNTIFTNTTALIIISSNGVPTGSPVGFPPVFGTRTRFATLNLISGDYYVIPPGICNFQVIRTLQTLVNRQTNTFIAVDAGASNIFGQSFTQAVVSFWTNRILEVRQTACYTNPVIRQGMEKLTFIRTSFDSIIGDVYAPQTTNYTLKSVMDGQIVTETFRRTITQPDFLFSAQDLADPDAPDDNLEYSVISRAVPVFARAPGLNAGPGIITSVGNLPIIFNKVGPIFDHTSPSFLQSQRTAGLYPILSSYDGTTNAPVLFGEANITDLMNQVLLQISPSTLPDGEIGEFYDVQLSVVGGTPPFTFSKTPNTPALPPGLTLTSNGRLFGTPTEDDTFDFAVRLSDSAGRAVDHTYSITISP